MASIPPLSLRLGRQGLEALDEIARRRRVSRAEAATLMEELRGSG